MELDIPTDRFVDGRIAFFTFTTRGFAPFVLNLHASIKRVDPPLADRLIVFCADEQSRARLGAAGLCTVHVGAEDLPEFADFASVGYGRVVSYKWILARRLLREAEYAWWCDGDIVFLQALGRRMPALLAGNQADMLMQHESPNDVLNGGFWIARRSAAVDEMLADMAQHTARADVEDQEYFNDRHAHAGRISVAGLDVDEFMCGHRFFYRPAEARARALVLHFNYTIGDSAKRRLMLEHDAWFLPESRSTRLRARIRHRLVIAGLRVGIWLAGPDTGIDTSGASVPRRRLLEATRRARLRLGRRPAR